MKYFLGLILLFTVAACGNNDQNTEAKDPSVTQPPSDAIPDSMKIVNDSAIVPDTTPGNGRQVGKSDSIQKNKH